MNDDDEDMIRTKQRSRALVTAALLGVLVLLFYFITMAKIGAS